jgi:hypothetical protein
MFLSANVETAMSTDLQVSPTPAWKSYHLMMTLHKYGIKIVLQNFLKGKNKWAKLILHKVIKYHISIEEKLRILQTGKDKIK